MALIDLLMPVPPLLWACEGPCAPRRSPALASIEVQQSSAGYLFSCALPGAKPSDVAVTLASDALTIRAPNGASETIHLPKEATTKGAQASLVNGELRIALRKQPKEALFHIPVSEGSLCETEEADTETVEVPVPGLPASALRVTVDPSKRLLSILGTSSSPLKRALRLSRTVDVERISGACEHGLLSIRLPRRLPMEIAVAEGPVEASEDEQVLMKVPLPGFSAADVHVELLDDTLRMRAHQQQGGDAKSDTEQTHKRSRVSAEVQRSQQLPRDVLRAVKAGVGLPRVVCANGMVTVIAPKGPADVSVSLGTDNHVECPTEEDAAMRTEDDTFEWNLFM